MALKIHSTRETAANTNINAVIYGQAGIGKTVLCSTAPSPLILSAEKGLLSLADKDIPYVELNSFHDLIEVYNELYQSKDLPYETICIDSLSDLCETILAERKKEERDVRQAYGKMAEEVIAAVRKFKKLPYHVIFIAKQGRVEDTLSGRQSYGPSFPGQMLPSSMPYQVDLLMAMRIGKHEGKEYRYLHTSADIQYEAKDRSGALSSKEPPDLNALITKIRDHAKTETNEEN